MNTRTNYDPTKTDPHFLDRASKIDQYIKIEYQIFTPKNNPKATLRMRWASAGRGLNRDTPSPLRSLGAPLIERDEEDHVCRIGSEEEVLHTMVAGTISRNPTPYHANERDVDDGKYSRNPDDDSVRTETTVASSAKTEASYNDFLSFVGSQSDEKASDKEIAEANKFSRTLTASTAESTVGDVDESDSRLSNSTRGSVNERRQQPSPTNIENVKILTDDKEPAISETENLDQTKKTELLKGASIATLHFATEDTRKEVERVKAINMAKQAAKEQAKTFESLPADYFTKQNEARLEAEKQAALDGLKDAPIAVRSKSNILYSTYSVSIGTYTACF